MKQERWFRLATGYHGLIDSSAVFATNKPNSNRVEGIIGIFSLVSLGANFIQRNSKPVVEAVPVSCFPPVAFLQVKPTNELLNNSKYIWVI